MVRGSSFALGEEPSRDAQGHSLPSDLLTQFNLEGQDRVEAGVSGTAPSAAFEPQTPAEGHDDQGLEHTAAKWWESVPSHQMGIEIAADVKAGTGRYRPLIEPLSCRNCRANGKRARMILAVYAGPDGSVWLWTAGYRGLRNHPGRTDQPIRTERIPPSARQVRVGFGSVAVCSNCRHGQPFFVQPNGINTNFDPAPPTFGRVT